MAKRMKPARRERTDTHVVNPKFAEERKQPPLKALTDNQAAYMADIMTKQMTVVMGPAGTGKTYIAATIAADMLRDRRIAKIILTRPNVPSGRSLGFFPGSMEEKIAPWVVPFTEVIRARMGAGAYEIAMKRGDIEVIPFEVMRGRTFNNAFVILDEAQNTTTAEIKMFLTRIGQDTKIVVNGDVAQSDLKGDCGLKTVIRMIDRYRLPVGVVEFDIEDIVRSDLCAAWVRAFHEDGI
jgi:phosphate starvation-inducible protein PhoH and related proteins